MKEIEIAVIGLGYVGIAISKIILHQISNSGI